MNNSYLVQMASFQVLPDHLVPQDPQAQQALQDLKEKQETQGQLVYLEIQVDLQVP